MNFFLDIIDTKRHIYSGEVKKLTLPSLSGEITILANHMPLVTPVKLGEIRVETADKELLLTVGKGIFSMDAGRASLLIEDARYTEEISESEAEQAKARAEEIIKSGVKGPDLEAARSVMRRSLIDMKARRRRKLPQ